MPGHVFLVHGDLTRFACDAWLLPSSNTPRPGGLWKHTVADTAPPGTPAEWVRGGPRVLPWALRQAGDPQPWLVLTARAPGAPADHYVRRAEEFLQAARANLPDAPRHGRALPLIALPVIGAGKAGGAHQAGDIVRHLLPALYAFVAANAVDVALVMKDPVQHAAAQAVRAELQGEQAWPELDDVQRAHNGGLVGRALRQELVLFLGAGVSQAAGLPSWAGLLQGLGGQALADDRSFGPLSPLDQAHLVQTHLGLDDAAFRDKVAGRVRVGHYALAHALLAALPVREVVTTNYDALFEDASRGIGRPMSSRMTAPVATAGGC